MALIAVRRIAGVWTPAARTDLSSGEAVEVGEHPVEDEGVEGGLAGGDRVHQAVAAGGGRLDGVAGLAQALGEIVPGVVVVLDDKDAARHAVPREGGAAAVSGGPGFRSQDGVRRA